MCMKQAQQAPLINEYEINYKLASLSELFMTETW